MFFGKFYSAFLESSFSDHNTGHVIKISKNAIEIPYLTNCDWFTVIFTFNSNFMSNTSNLIFPVDIYLMLLSGLAFQLYIMLNFSCLNSICIDK